MADEDRYTGPAVGVEARARLKARAERFVRRRGEEIHRQQVTGWAAADSGDYPSRSEADQDALEELEVLLRGIGRWGLVDPETLPQGRRWPRGGRALSDWEQDLLE